MARVHVSWLALVLLLGYSSASPFFDPTKLKALTHLLEGIPENYFQTKGAFLGVLECRDNDPLIDEENLELTLSGGGADFLRLGGGPKHEKTVLLRGYLDFENILSRNDKKVEFFCTNTLSQQSIVASYFIEILDINDNAPTFVKTGGNTQSDTYRAIIDEVLDIRLRQLPYMIFNAINVTDIDGVNNNEIEAECVRIETTTEITDETIMDCASAGLFSLKSRQTNNGVYTFEVYAQKLDYSNYSDFTLVIRAKNVPKNQTSNPIQYSKTQNVVIKIRDIQNLPPIIDKNRVEFSMYENHPVNTEVVVGQTIRAWDQDKGDPNPIKFELAPNVNDPYGFNSGFFKLGQVFVDRDNAYNVQFILDKPIDRELVNESSKIVTVNIRAIEYAANASDTTRNPMSAEAEIVVTILDINDQAPQFNFPVYNITLNEQAGTITDADLYTQISYSVNIVVEDVDSNAYNSFNVDIIDGNPGSLFRLNSREGTFSEGFTISAKNAILDYDNSTYPNQYTLLLRATDKQEPSLQSTATVYVNIVDVNDNSPVFDKTSYLFSVPENTPIGTTVGMIRATDIDSGTDGEIQAYKLTDNNFAINPSTGVITTKTLINYEARDSYVILVEAVDGGGRATEVLVQVSVQDRNDLDPEFKANYSSRIFEESFDLQPPIIIEAINREGTGNVTYAVESVNPSTVPLNTFSVGRFDGVVKVNNYINYKDTINGVVIVTFKATTDTLHAYATATITVNDINNFAPEFVQSQPDGKFYAIISEVADAGDVVIQLNATDLDGPNTESGQFQFSIQKGANDDFTIGKDSGKIQVARKDRLNVDKQERYDIVVQVRDKGNPSKSATATVVVTLEDANNQAPTFNIPLYLFQMKEDDPIGTEVDTVSAVDSDRNNKLVYSIDFLSLRFEKKTNPVVLRPDESKVISMDPNSGTLRVAGKIDRSRYDRFSLNVIVVDENGVTAGQSGTASVVVTILASVDPAIYFASPWSKDNEVIEKTFVESQIYNNQIFTLKATDPTIPGPVETYMEQPGSDRLDYFNVNGSVVVLKKPLDYESPDLGPGKQLSVVILAISNDRYRTGTATLVVTIQDLNDNAPQFDKLVYEFSVAEDKTYPLDIGTVRATDADSSSYGEIQYSLPPDSDFGVYTTRTGSGFEARLFVAQNKTLDFETIPEYTLQLTATDNPESSDGVQLKNITNVVIKILDENDHAPVFGEDIYDFSVVGTKEMNGDVGIVLAKDKDAGFNGRVTYSIRSATANGKDYFGIKDDVQTTANIEQIQTFGNIYVRSSLESLPDRSYFELTVVATDRGISPVFTGSCIVRITVSKGVQDPKPKWDNGLETRVKILEHSALGTFVANITAKPANETSGIVYSFVEGGDATGDFLSFDINRNTGRITVAKDLDYETYNFYSLLILATDSKNSSLTNQYLLVVEVLDINDNRPSFTSCKDKYDVPETAYVMEAVPPAVSVYTVQACDSDQYPNNVILYSWFVDNSYCNADVQDVFDLNENTGLITTRLILDREERDKYLLCVKATPAGLRKKRDMISDLKARDNHDEVLYLQVFVLDANDNGPRFPDRQVKKVILQYPESQISIAEAYDSDLPPNNDIRYSIENITFVIRGKSQLAPAAFSINAADGTISAGTNDYSDYNGGYFDIAIKAEDKGQPSNEISRQVQRVYVTTRASQIRVVFNSPADLTVETKAREMIDELNGLDDEVYYELKKISYHIKSNDEDPVFDKTDVCLVVIDNNNVLPAVTAAKSVSDTRSVDRVLSKYGAVEPGPCDPARSIYPEGWESYWWVLVAFAIFIFVCVCILIFMVIMLYRSYKRYMTTRKTYLVQTTPM